MQPFISRFKAHIELLRPPLAPMDLAMPAAAALLAVYAVEGSLPPLFPFILASLVKVFNVREVQPLYRLSLLTALAYLLVAPMALVAHLGDPERFYEILLTPQTSSAMASDEVRPGDSMP